MHPSISDADYFDGLLDIRKDTKQYKNKVYETGARAFLVTKLYGHIPKSCQIFNPILVGGGGRGEEGKNYPPPQEKNVKHRKNRQAACLPGLFTKQNFVFDVSGNFQVNLSF